MRTDEGLTGIGSVFTNAGLVRARAVRRWHREAAFMVGQSVDAVRCHLARARDQLRAAVYRRGESTWTRPAAARPQDQPVSELVQ